MANRSAHCKPLANSTELIPDGARFGLVDSWLSSCCGNQEQFLMLFYFSASFRCILDLVTASFRISSGGQTAAPDFLFRDQEGLGGRTRSRARAAPAGCVSYPSSTRSM